MHSDSQYEELTGGSDPLRDHFTLVERLTEAGDDFFEAEDRRRSGRYIVHLFSRQDDPLRAEDEILCARALLANPHENFIMPVDAEAGERPFVAYEKVYGFRVLDVLRRRRQLPYQEAILLVQQVARAVDHAVRYGISGFDLRSGCIRIAFNPELDSREIDSLTDEAVTEWPDFVVKLGYPGAYPGSDSGATTGSARLATAGDPAVLRSNYHLELGRLTQEILGGRRIPGTSKTFVPLAALSARSNRVLRRILDPASSEPFGSALDFVDALRHSVRNDQRRSGGSAPTLPYSNSTYEKGTGPKPVARRNQSATTVRLPRESANRSAAAPASIRVRRPRRRPVGLIIVILMAVAAVGIAAYFLVPWHLIPDRIVLGDQPTRPGHNAPAGIPPGGSIITVPPSDAADANGAESPATPAVSESPASTP